METKDYPSLELCKKLTEIEFPDTLYRHISDRGHVYGQRDSIAIKNNEGNVCPSVMEMLSVIYNSTLYADGYYLKMTQVSPKEMEEYKDYYEVYMCSERKGMKDAKFFKGTLPNSLAKMILWLVENNYLNVNS